MSPRSRIRVRGFGGDLLSQLEDLLGASGYLWYADDLTNGAVASWADRIQGLAAVQATGSKQPVAQDNLATGRREVVPDGGDSLLSAGFSGGAIAQPFIIYAVSQFSDASGSLDRLISSFGANAAGVYQQADAYKMYSGAVLTGDAVSPGCALLSANFNGASSTYHRNSVLMTSGDAGAVGMDGVAIFSDRAGTGEFWGAPASLLAIDPSGDTAKRAQIETIINQLYNDIYTMLFDDNGDPLLDDLNNVLRED